MKLKINLFQERNTPTSVLLIYTGGTIGMKADPADGTLKPFDFSGILEEVPELRKFAMKIDAYTFTPKDADDLTPATRENLSLEELQRTWMAKLGGDCLFISAAQRVNIDALKTTLYQRVRELHVQKYPYNDFLFQHYDEENPQT